MKITIDTKKITSDDNLKPESLMYLLSLWVSRRPITQDIPYKLLKAGYIKGRMTSLGELWDIQLTQKGMDVVDNTLLNSEFQEKTEEGEDIYLAAAKQMREFFPMGKKSGCSLTWRDSAPIIALKLKALAKNFGEYPLDLAIKATEEYVKSFNGVYTYMQVLSNFISKDEYKNEHWETRSQLLACMSQIQEGGKLNDNSDSWNLLLR